LLVVFVTAKPLPAQTALNPVEAMRNEWVSDWKTKNMNGLRSLYEGDSTFIPASVDRNIVDGLVTEAGLIAGQDSIGKYLEQIITSSVGDLIFLPYGPGEVSGKVAYDSGFIQYILKNGSHGKVVKANYLMILRRDSGGKWYIVRQSVTEI
jgi:ketosteroid isomerase-like protein